MLQNSYHLKGKSTSAHPWVDPNDNYTILRWNKNPISWKENLLLHILKLNLMIIAQY